MGGGSIADWLKHYWEWKKSRAALSGIRASGHPLAFKLVSAIETTAKGRFSAVDRDIVGKIENLRNALAGSSETVESVDFGAGEPSDPKSREEARQGVVRSFEMSTLAHHFSKKPPWTDLIYNLIRAVRPAKSLEMGTCIGISAAYQCAAMARNGEGLLVTLEGCETFAGLARSHLASLGLSNFEIVVGRFEDTLDGVLENGQPFDFMFNDGHHDGDAVVAYFNQCIPYFANDSVMVFDDIGNYKSMRQGWKALTEHAGVALSISFGTMGLIVLGRQENPKLNFDIRLPYLRNLPALALKRFQKYLH